VKDYLVHALRTSSSPLHGRNLVREYLQARILGALQRAGAFVLLAFYGGTALRFLFSIPRWSENLGFALERPDPGCDFRAWLEAARSEMAKEGYAIDLAKVKDDKVVHTAFVRFPGLLHELGLSPHRQEALSVKLEVDTRPPPGASLEITVVRRHVLLRLQHHDKPSLLAGKLHAILQRSYPKGRDLFDLLWYLSDRSWPGPNLEMLNHALKQTGWEGPTLSESSWRPAVRKRLRTLPWKQVVADVRPFLERSDEADLLTPEELLRLLQ